MNLSNHNNGGDMQRAGAARERQIRGRRRKLTDDQLIEARVWWATVNAFPTLAQMARRFGIGKETLRRACKGYSYKVPARHG